MYVCMYIKGNKKQATESVKVQSVLFEDAVRLKISVIKICQTNCLVIAIFYAKDVDRGITNKPIIVVVTSSCKHWHT